MTLTHEDVALLSRRFAANEHEFFDGLAYVDEVAVTTRLDEVDPSWTFTRISEPVRTEDQCIVWMRLTVNGVSRDGVGMSKIWLKKKDGQIILNGEPEKSAATDALRRASRLFGVGRYLLTLPKNVNDYNSLAKWLGETPRKTQSQPEQQAGAVSDVTHFACSEVIVKMSAKNKPFLVFPNINEPNQYATDFSRERLRQAGYNVDGWDKVGEYPLNPPALITARMDGDYLNVTEIAQDTPL